MPVKVSVQEPTRFVVDATGQVTGAETMRALQTILSDSHLAHGATVLVVARDVTGTPHSDELRDLAVATVALKERGLAGFAIVTEQRFVYGVARMFAALAELAGISVDVFRDQDAARSRLDELSARAA